MPISNSRAASFSSILLAASVGLLPAIAGCGSATPAPLAATAKPVVKGPFGRLTLPPSARTVWIVYRETWRVVKTEDAGPDAAKPVPTLRRRDLMTIAVLRPDAQGHIEPPATPKIGSHEVGDGWELDRVHAIVVVPGKSVIDWDSHAFESSPTPAESPPVAPDALHAIEDGCEAVEGLAAFFRDFPQGIRTGLSAHEFSEVAYPVVGAMLSTLVAHLPGPGDEASYDADADDTSGNPAKEKTCEGYGETRKAFRAQLFALRAWVDSQPGNGDGAGGTPKGEPPAKLVGVDHDARWGGVVELWSQGELAAPSIRQALASTDGDERLAALVAAWGARSAVAVVPDLLRVVRGKDARERAFALDALRHAGTPSAAAVPAIVELIVAADAGDDADAWAKSALASMGLSARSAAKPLIEQIKTTKDPLRKARALDGLRSLGANAGDALSDLVDLLRSDDAEVADGALAVLRAIGEGAKPVLSALLTATKDPSAATRERACLAIAAMGKGATDAIEPMKERLTDTEPRVRQAALQVYAALGPASAPMLDPIRTAMFDASPIVRTQAARTLGAMGPAAAKAAPFLGDVLADPVASVQEAAAITLGGLGPAAKPALPKLVALLETTTSNEVRHAAASAIVEIGPDAAGEIPKVIAVLEKNNAWYLPQVIERIGKTMKKQAAPHLGKLLSGKPEPVERAAIVALGSLGKDAVGEVPKLAKLLEQPGLSSYVFGALGNIGEGAAAAIDPILDVLSRRNDLRVLCLSTLPKLGPKVVAPLTKLMVDPKKDPQLRLSIVRAMFEVGPKAVTSTVPILETLSTLAPSDTWTIAGFRRMGKDAPAHLVTATKDKRPPVKRLAVLTLGQLGPDAAKEAILALLAVATDEPVLRAEALSSIARYGKATAVPILDAILADASKKKLHAEAREMLGRFG